MIHYALVWKQPGIIYYKLEKKTYGPEESLPLYTSFLKDMYMEMKTYIYICRAISWVQKPRDC